MAVNYNSGEWFGWNGGECPVHPETVVECVCLEGEYTSHTDGDAGEWNWDDEICPIIAFRVIKEHKEPREFWLFWSDTKSDWLVSASKTYAYEMHPKTHGHDVVHVREVLE